MIEKVVVNIFQELVRNMKEIREQVFQYSYRYENVHKKCTRKKTKYNYFRGRSQNIFTEKPLATRLEMTLGRKMVTPNKALSASVKHRPVSQSVMKMMCDSCNTEEKYLMQLPLNIRMSPNYSM